MSPQATPGSVAPPAGSRLGWAAALIWAVVLASRAPARSPSACPLLLEVAIAAGALLGELSLVFFGVLAPTAEGSAVLARVGQWAVLAASLSLLFHLWRRTAAASGAQGSYPNRAALYRPTYDTPQRHGRRHGQGQGIESRQMVVMTTSVHIEDFEPQTQRRSCACGGAASNTSWASSIHIPSRARSNTSGETCFPAIVCALREEATRSSGSWRRTRNP